MYLDRDMALYLDGFYLDWYYIPEAGAAT